MQSDSLAARGENKPDAESIAADLEPSQTLSILNVLHVQTCFHVSTLTTDQQRLQSDCTT